MTHTVSPSSPDELQRIVAENAAARRPLYPVGGGTALDYGYPPSVPGVTVSTERLAALIDYPARDMTVTVQAGMTVDALTRTLAAERQQLPIDVPQADRATLGGILATNVSGPRRFGYGTLRDYVIGITAVDGQGRLFSAGGRVVKNVAGYDLCKLLVGSLGTLAIITQVTLKLRPLPERTGLLWATFDRPDALDAALGRLLTSDTRPVIVDVLNRAAVGAALRGGPASGPPAFAETRFPKETGFLTLVIGVEGAAADVAWQLDRLRSELEPFQPAGLTSISDETVSHVQTALTDFQVADERQLTFRAHLPPSRTVELLDAASRKGIAVQAHAANGIIVGRLPDEVASAAAAREMLDPLRRLAREQRGNLVITRCPAAWKSELPLFGEPEPSWPLMRKIKTALDPHRLLNPGRFLDAAG